MTRPTLRHPAANPFSGWDMRTLLDQQPKIRANPDGTLSFEDRIKDVLKVGGENVSAAEVERVILSLPGVPEAAVVARADRMLNEVPVAFVLASGGQDPLRLESEIEGACKRSLADFKQPPSAPSPPRTPGDCDCTFPNGNFSSNVHLEDSIYSRSVTMRLPSVVEADNVPDR